MDKVLVLSTFESVPRIEEGNILYTRTEEHAFAERQRIINLQMVSGKQREDNRHHRKLLTTESHIYDPRSLRRKIYFLAEEWLETDVPSQKRVFTLVDPDTYEERTFQLSAL